jgi:hypothetical protein
MKCIYLGLVLALFAGQTASAQFQKPVRGETVAKRTEKLMTGIEWQRSFSDVEDAAAQSGKLIFWLHVVGDLEDGL